MLKQAAKHRRHSLHNYYYDLFKTNREFISSSDVQDSFSGKDSTTLREEDLTIWVDPLDGSKGFTEGHTHHLTCIIGVSIRNRPRLGIIHKPFSNYPFPGCGRTYVGTPEHGLYTVDNFVDDVGNFTLSQAKYVPPFQTGRNICKSSYRPQICASHNKNQQ
jgi:3'-phosphoadenosine 5'-phosphosulfate (PAPS) 3'-phosphatase